MVGVVNFSTPCYTWPGDIDQLWDFRRTFVAAGMGHFFT